MTTGVINGGFGLSVATSKFSVPRRRADVIRRARLNSLLDAAVGSKGTVIAAPAGYGKTTLVVDWLEASDFATVWLSLDEWDADLGAFTRSISAAIARRFDMDVQIGDERFWQPRTVGTVLVNTIAAQDDYVVLVLDDVHLLQGCAEVIETLAFLLERAPDNLHVVMTSRMRPPVPSLPRLIARREVATIGASDLAFTPREIRDLLATLGRSISEEDADALFERTEGWAAALLLGAAAGSANGVRALIDGERDVGGAGSVVGPNAALSIADYVHGEALEQVPEQLRRFLRTISLLPVWTPALCDDVTGRRDSERLLHEAASSVLFITQHSEDPPMYRCHQLLRALLMQRFRAEDPLAYDDAGRAASEALTRYGLLNEAVELLFDLGEWSQSAALLEQIAPRLIQQGQARALAEWIDRLPHHAREGTSHLQIWRARASYKLQEYDEALRLIEDALSGLRDHPDREALVSALFVRGETQRRKGYYDEALSTFGEARTIIQSAEDEDLQLEGDALRNIGVTHMITGDLDSAIGELGEARRLLEQVGDLQGIGNACASLAECYGRRTEPLPALGALQRAQSAFERAGNTYDLGLTLNNTGMVYFEIGEYEHALQVYERGLRLMRGAGNAMFEASILAGIAETYRAMSRFAESDATYDEVRPIAAGLDMARLAVDIAEGAALTKLYLGEGEQAESLLRSVQPKSADAAPRLAAHALVRAQVCLEKADPGAALKALAIALPHFEQANRRGEVAVASFLRARAFFDARQPRKAMSELERVASMCDKLGYHRFLRPYAARANALIEYAVARHVAEPLLKDLQPDRARSAQLDGVASSGDHSPAAMLPPVRAFAFGRGGVLVGERQVSDLEWRSEKSKEMFFLLLSKRESVRKEEIFAALWPDLPESKCNSNFHSSLYRLRRAIFHECVVRSADGGYELNPKGTFTSDVDAFDHAMSRADAARDEPARVTALEEAVALYNGAFLSSTYSDWTEPLRRSLEDRYIEALSELAAYRLRAGAFEEALVLFKSLETVDPYSEAAIYGVMRCHLGLNDGPAAARQYRRFRQLLKDELDEEPSERLAALYREAAPS